MNNIRQLEQKLEASQESIIDQLKTIEKFRDLVRHLQVWGRLWAWFIMGVVYCRRTWRSWGSSRRRNRKRRSLCLLFPLRRQCWVSWRHRQLYRLTPGYEDMRTGERRLGVREREIGVWRLRVWEWGWIENTLKYFFNTCRRLIMSCVNWNLNSRLK